MAGKKGYQSKMAHKTREAERWQHNRQGQCHASETLNLWNEQDMQAALTEYQQVCIIFDYISKAYFLYTTTLCFLCFNIDLHVSICHFSQCRQCGAANVSITSIAKFFGIPKTTFWKHVTGKVVGQGHQSGGKGQPRVLSQGTVKHSISNYLDNISKIFW